MPDQATSDESKNSLASTSAASAAMPGASTSSSPSETTTRPNPEQSSTAATPNGDSTPAWLAALKDVDPDELIRRLPALQGKLGASAQKLAEKEIARERAQLQRDTDQRRRDESDAAERLRLAQLRETNPIAYVDEEKRLEAATAEARATWNQVDAMLASFHAALPDAVKETLAGKHYPGNPIEARQAYLADVTEHLALTKAEESRATAIEQELAAARKKWETEELPARRKTENNLSVGSEPSLDLGAGAAASGTGALTKQEFDRNKKDSGWMRANKARINEALATGRLFS